jgi:hypothetical protein
MLGQLDQEQRLEPNAHRLWVDIGVRSAEHPIVTQSFQTFVSARWGQPDAGSNLLVGEARIVLQQTQDAEIRSVE